MEKIIVIGGGGHAKVIISILKKTKKYEIIGFTELNEKDSILGVPFIGDDNIFNDKVNKDYCKLVLGIGQIKTSEYRKRIVEKLLYKGFDFPVIISPDCIINEEVKFGRGTIIMDGVVINSGTKIGELSIINTNSSVDHDCQIGSYTHIAPGVTLSGDVKIGDDCLIGTGANIIQGINIINKSIISAGSSVQYDIHIPGIYRGVPAQFIK